MGRAPPLTRAKMRQRATQFPTERAQTRETTTRARGQVRGPPRTACTLLARARMHRQDQQVAGGAAERRLSPQLLCRPRRSLYRDKNIAIMLRETLGQVNASVMRYKQSQLQTAPKAT